MKNISLGATMVMVLLTAVLCSGCSQPENTTTSQTYDTPEKAIQSFINAVKSNDYDAAISICPAKKIAEGYDYAAYVEKKSMPSGLLIVPSNNEYNTKANADIFKGHFATRVVVFTNTFFILNATDFNEAVENTTDLSTLKNLSVISIDEPYLVNKESYITLMNEQGTFFGADEMTERVALIEFEGKTYVEGFTLLRYGDSWGIQYLYSELASTPSQGTPTAMTQEEYNGLISQDR